VGAVLKCAGMCFAFHSIETQKCEHKRELNHVIVVYASSDLKKLKSDVARNIFSYTISTDYYTPHVWR